MKNNWPRLAGIIGNCLLLLFLSCGPQHKIYYTRGKSTVTIDSIHTTVFKDSTGLDTIKYHKQYVKTDKGAVRIHGAWYIIAGIAVGTIIVMLLRR
jgi:hypothetical protein